MADSLKQTLYWSANPDHALDFADNGLEGFTGNITAAGSHDGSDASPAIFSAPDDNVTPGNANGGGTVDKAVDTASVSGTISFLRIKYRGKRPNLTNIGATIQPLIAGVTRGSATTMSATFTDYSQDFATDPADGLAWTNAKVNAQRFGVYLAAWSTAPTYNRTSEAQLSEFSVELWGPASDTSTPGAVSGVGGVIAAAVVAGLVVSACGPVSGAGDLSAATAIAGPVSSALDVVEGVGELSSGEHLKELPNVGALRPEATFVDTSGVAPVTLRSFKASLSDQTTATKDTFTSTGSGTQLQPLYGTASQGLQGNAINGTGTISGIKLCALIRVSKQATGTITNVRFGTGMGTKALLTPAIVRDYDAGLTDEMWQSVETDIITVGATAQPFEWGSGANSVWAQMFGWTMNMTYGGTGTKQLEVAEAWVEVLTPVGLTVPPIEVRAQCGAKVKTLAVRPAITE